MSRLLPALLLLAACDPSAGTSVRATLADGQVMLGDVYTETLRLEGGLGALEIPLADVGEVVPVEGGELARANGHVNVWLRNGSELRGRWAEPELAMGIAVGGERVAVELPMDRLQRFQLQGGEVWPQGRVYRVRTTHGDDFLVDPARTRLVIDNDFGTFAPFLAECASAYPVGAPDGDWRVELATGTVLVGRLRDEAIELALPLGPETVRVPLAAFVALDVQDWGRPPSGGEHRSPASGDGAAPAASPAPAEWFENDSLEMRKSQL